jgi:hypothetical protein
MSANTAKYLIPYAVAGDAVSTLPTIMANMAARLDLMAGEAGQVTVAAAAGTQFNLPVVLSRTYFGNNGAAVPGWVGVTAVASLFAGNTQIWVDTFTGSATTVTGFTIRGVSSVAGTRTFNWKFLPNP